MLQPTWCKITHLFKATNIAIAIRTLLVAQSVEPLSGKPEGRGFDSRWCHWDFFH